MLATDKPTVLIVEDDCFIAIVTHELLSVDYNVHHVEDGEAALVFIRQQVPDLVLLDISMPGMSGYDVCRSIRNDLDLDDLPVIFLSGMVGDEERLAGYEAGGNDFLAKPVVAAELRFKIDLALKASAERKRLSENLASTFATAMTAMTAASEIGAVLHFLRTSFSCADYADLAYEIVNSAASFGCDAHVQIRGEQGVHSVNQSGPCSPLEEAMLYKMSDQGRLVEFSDSIACSFDHVTVILKDVDSADEERYGRLKDNIALLVEGADVRVVALDRDVELLKKHNALVQLLFNTKAALTDIDKQYRQQRIDSDQILQDMQFNFEERFMTLGLSGAQEDELNSMIKEALDRSLALFDNGVSTDHYMETILNQLDEEL